MDLKIKPIISITGEIVYFQKMLFYFQSHEEFLQNEISFLYMVQN